MKNYRMAWVLAAVLICVGRPLAQDAKPVEAVVKKSSGEQVQGVIQGRIALDDGPPSVVLLQGRDIERIDETGVYVRVGGEMSAGQVTIVSNTEVFRNSPRLDLLQVLAANEPALNERKLLPNSLPQESGMMLIRGLVNANLKMPLKAPSHPWRVQVREWKGRGDSLPAHHLR
jgi:hypothetical protein